MNILFAFVWYCLFCSIDGTNSTRLGRYVNDSPRKSKSANCTVRAIELSGKQRVLLFAQRDIGVGEELRYDYGGGDLPWRKVGFCFPNCVEFVLFHV